jgi:hypothetical protein
MRSIGSPFAVNIRIGVRSPPAHPAAHRQPVLTRHHQVEHDCIGGGTRELLGQRIPVGHSTNRKAMFAEKPLEQTTQFGIVIDDNDARRGGSSSHGVPDMSPVAGRVITNCCWMPRRKHGVTSWPLCSTRVKRHRS